MCLCNPEQGALWDPIHIEFKMVVLCPKMGLWIEKVLMHIYIRFFFPGSSLQIDCSTKDPLTQTQSLTGPLYQSVRLSCPAAQTEKHAGRNLRGYVTYAYRTLLTLWLFLIHALKRHDIRILHKVTIRLLHVTACTSSAGKALR